MPDAALELLDISKRFGTVTALDHASLTAHRGSIHALLGENGAGKTTLMRIAFGMMRPDTGSITVGGTPRRLASSADAIAAGIGMVHQQFSLVPAMTVAENVALGGKGRFRPEEVAQRIADVGSRTGLVLDPARTVATLSSAEKQKLEIVRTFAHDARILILDEPTAVLTSRDTDELFTQLRAFADSGGTVILITHKLHDALAHADAVTVLRRGSVALAGSMSGLSRKDLSSAMLGFAPDARSPMRQDSTSPGAVVATLRDVVLRNDRGISQPLSFEIRKGEIVGVAALDGAAGGLLRVLAGRTTPRSGTVTTPSHVAFVPENRQDEALIPEFDLAENFALRNAGQCTGLMRWSEMHDDAQAVIAAFDVKAATTSVAARTLSGGNQQRFVLGRELSDDPELLILENPTQGLDVSAASAVHARMEAAAKKGTAIVFYSSDLDELAQISDRVLVVRRSGLALSEPERDAIGQLLLEV